MPFKSKAQQRFMFAAEARGEVPKGTAKRWADETPNIKRLPEKKMEKKAMFFEGQDPVEDGMFMKRAQDLKLPETTKPKPPKLEAPKPERQHTTTEEAVKGSKPKPPPPPKPAMAGHGGTKCAMLGIPKAAQTGAGMLPPQGGSMDVSAGGTSSAPMMGTGGKSKKKTSVKKEAASTEEIVSKGKDIAGRVGERATQFGSKMLEGTGKALSDVPGGIDKVLKYVENLPPAAQAALVGGTGYVAAKKIGKGVSRAVGRKPAPSALRRLLRKVVTRGR